MLIFDNFWWLALPGIFLAIYAQFRVSSTYRRFLQQGLSSNLSGAEAARMILDDAGLYEMPVAEVDGHLTDHYDPLKKALFLSSENYHGRSISSVGVAAHEAGHALQHKASYAFLKLRMMLVPATQFASTAAYFIFMASYFMHIGKFTATLAVGIFAVIALFQVITLPVEYDASRRAKIELDRLGIVRGGEGAGVSKVLNAAALTYVAAMVTGLLTLLHWVLIMNSRDRD
jgi:Zn-dependent membrane protease YugP